MPRRAQTSIWEPALPVISIVWIINYPHYAEKDFRNKNPPHTYTCIHTWGAASLSRVSFIKLLCSLKSLQESPTSWLITPLTALCPGGLVYFLCACPPRLPNQSLSPLPAAAGADGYIGDQQHGVYQPVQPGDAAQAPGPGPLWLHQEPLQRLRQRHRHHQVGFPGESRRGSLVVWLRLRLRLNSLSRLLTRDLVIAEPLLCLWAQVLSANTKFHIYYKKSNRKHEKTGILHVME